MSICTRNSGTEIYLSFYEYISRVFIELGSRWKRRGVIVCYDMSVVISRIGAGEKKERNKKKVKSEVNDLFHKIYFSISQDAPSLVSLIEICADASCSLILSDV